MAKTEAITPTVVTAEGTRSLSKAEKKTLNELTTRLQRNLADTVGHLVEIGRDLIQAKDLVGHGNFSRWLQENFDLSDQTARNFMHVAEVFGERVEGLKKLSLSSIYLLAAPSTSTEVRETVLERLENGETLTRQDILALREKAGDSPAQEASAPVKEATFRSDVRKVNQKLAVWTEQLQKEWRGIDGAIGKKSKAELETLQEGLTQLLSTLGAMLDNAKAPPKKTRKPKPVAETAEQTELAPDTKKKQPSARSAKRKKN